MPARPLNRMSELRRDPILRRWVIMAPERGADTLARRGEPPADAGEARGPCPFCPGSESLNPDEIAVVRDGTGWAVRVTPDKKPLLHIEGDLGRRAAGMFDLMNAIGAHELVTDVPAHTLTWADFPLPQMTRLLELYRARTRDLRRDTRFRFVVVLKNHGATWSRYGHSHSHVVATPFPPKRLEEEDEGARRRNSTGIGRSYRTSATSSGWNGRRASSRIPCRPRRPPAASGPGASARRSGGPPAGRAS